MLETRTKLEARSKSTKSGFVRMYVARLCVRVPYYLRDTSSRTCESVATTTISAAGLAIVVADTVHLLLAIRAG